MEIVKLIGADILPEDQKLIIETAKLFRVGFLQQNAYHPIDTYVPLDKQLRMMELMLKLYHGAKDIVSRPSPVPAQGDRHLRVSGQDEVRGAQRRPGEVRGV